jgi:hypothetical protein
MAVVVGTLVALFGLVFVVIGLGIFIIFRLGLRIFDQSLQTEVAGQGREQVERAAMKIKNPFVRRFVLQHLVATGGALAVSLVRGGLQSRMRTGLWMALAGLVALIGAFFTGKWLPLVWTSAGG